MNKDILTMVEKVSVINLIIGFILTGVVQLIFRKYGLFVLVGMLIAIINFSVNCILSDFITSKLKRTSAILYVFNFIVRVALAAGIGYVIFIYNKYSVIAYLFGYTSHLVGIYIYSSFEK